MSVNIYNSNPNATSEEENFSCVADRGSKLASDTIYDNTTSGLNSVNVQGAIDEVNDKVEDNIEAISQINSDLTERTTWVSKGSALGTNYISLPSNFSEVHIVVLLGSNDRIALNVLKDDLLPNQSTYFNDGYFMDNSHYCRVAIQFTSDNKVTLASCFYNSNSNSASNTYFGVKIR